MQTHRQNAAVGAFPVRFNAVNLTEFAACRHQPRVLLRKAEQVACQVQILESIAGRDSLRDYPLLYSTLGELWLRNGDRARAAEEFSHALELPSTMPEKRFLLRKLESCR